MISLLGALLLAASVADKVPNAVYEHIELGNRFYEQGLYNEAGREYAMAAELSKDLPVVNYNLGNVYHQKMMETKAAPASATGNGPTSREWADRAATAYKQATDSPWQSLAAQAYFNLGTTYAREGKIDEAILALREALRLLPDDADTKHNLELLLREKKTQKKDASLPLKVKTAPEKPRMQKGKGLGSADSGGGGGGESGEPGGGGHGENPAGDNAQAGSSGSGSPPDGGGGSGGAPDNPGGAGTGALNQADDKKQDRLAQKDASKQTGETQKASKNASSDPAGDAAQQAALSTSTSSLGQQQSSQDASVSNLSHRDRQVLHKANELEQRMVDGWARPPDFKKPVEKDW